MFEYDDTYTGPRFTYRSPLRPIQPMDLPDGFTAVIRIDPNQDYRTITTTTPLPERFIAQWSLERA